MKIVLLAAVLAVPGLACAQRATLPANPPSAAQVLANAPAQAAAVFAVGSSGELIHRPSGFRCPATAGSAALVGVAFRDGVGSCQYADSFQPVIRVEFLPRQSGEVLPKAFCEGLPAALGVNAGPALPGARLLEGPSVPGRLGEVLVKGEWTPIWQCIWARAPFRPVDIVVDAAAIRPAGGWTARLIQTPAPPAQGREPVYSVYDLLRPIFLTGTVVAGKDAAHR
jgi:hypothetical protein